VVKGALAAMGSVVVVSTAAGAKGARESRAAGDVVAEAGEVMETGEVV